MCVLYYRTVGLGDSKCRYWSCVTECYRGEERGEVGAIFLMMLVMMVWLAVTRARLPGDLLTFQAKSPLLIINILPPSSLH